VVGNGLVISPIGFSQEGFRFVMSGPGGIYTIFASPDLSSWGVLTTTNAPPGAVVFTDATTSGFARRFYRVQVQ